MLTYSDLKKTLRADYYRNFGTSNIPIIKVIINPKIRFFFLFRYTNYFIKKDRTFINKVFTRILYCFYNYTQIKLSLDIPAECEIGMGLFLPHQIGIVINGNAIIGNNSTILQQVTIGNNVFKDMERVAIIGNNVQIGAGAKIIGPLNIGNNVVIGANAVVVNDIEDESVVGGIPAKKLSKKLCPIYNEYKGD